MSNKGFFILGTDTHVGKTQVALSLLSVFNRQRYSTIGLKPLASGGHATTDGLRNTDALSLQQTASIALPYEQINPFCFMEPIAPHIAAERANCHLSVLTIKEACQAVWSYSADYHIVEGIGGICVPLNEKETYADFVQDMRFPVILVVGLRLGCLNQALLSWEYLRQRKIHVAGWLAKQMDAQMECVAENVTFLKRVFPFPCLGFLPYLKQANFSMFSSLIDYKTLLKLAL
jgi:dethiobiotin synthetase